MISLRCSLLLPMLLLKPLVNPDSILAEMTCRVAESEVKRLIKKLEGDVLKYAETLEKAIINQCLQPSNDFKCHGVAHHECLTPLGNPTCEANNQDRQIFVPKCFNNNCGFLVDYQNPTYRFPYNSIEQLPDGNPEDKEVIKSICASHQVAPWLRFKRENDKDFFRDFGIDPPQYHVGFQNGAFQIFPGRPTEQSKCGTYDPRVRPWYQAASKGQINLILLLDTSGSMKDPQILGRSGLDKLKIAANQVIQSLTAFDRVAVVQFSNDANLHADPDGHLLPATQDNKNKLSQAINNFTAVGKSNFYDAFQLAFDTLTKAIDQELHVDCNSAILFLTDGRLNANNNGNNRSDEEDVMELVQKGLEELNQMIGHPTLLFTHSIVDGNENDLDDEINPFPKELACANGGIWSKIDGPDQILDSLSSYYQSFAQLGVDQNAGFTTWVEAYRFATGNILGTTISTPVYDRSDPENPIFVGVAGIDLPFESILRALGVSESSVCIKKEIDRIIFPNLQCPGVDTSHCSLEAVRLHGIAGSEAQCGDKGSNITCTTFPEDSGNGKSCGTNDFSRIGPFNILTSQHDGRNICCDCPSLPRGFSHGVIAAVVVVGVVILAAIGVIIVLARKRRRNRDEVGDNATEPVNGDSAAVRTDPRIINSEGGPPESHPSVSHQNSNLAEDSLQRSGSIHLPETPLDVEALSRSETFNLEMTTTRNDSQWRRSSRGGSFTYPHRQQEIPMHIEGHHSDPHIRSHYLDGSFHGLDARYYSSPGRPSPHPQSFHEMNSPAEDPNRDYPVTIPNQHDAVMNAELQNNGLCETNNDDNSEPRRKQVLQAPIVRVHSEPEAILHVDADAVPDDESTHNESNEGHQDH